MTPDLGMFATFLPFEIDRPAWAVMAPTAGSMQMEIGEHRVYWTQRGDWCRCCNCHVVWTLEEFENNPECVT